MKELKLLERYYQIGTREEDCEASKIMSIALIVSLCSIALYISSYFILLILPMFALFCSILAVMVFALSSIFSYVMIFISKQHSKIKILNIICYLLFSAIIILVFVFFSYVVKDYSALKKVTEEAVEQILKDRTGILIAALIVEVVFNMSMLVSFKVRNLKEHPLALIGFIFYILAQGVNFFAIFVGKRMPSELVAIATFLWIPCLYFALENRKVKVPCVVLKTVEEDGEKEEISSKKTTPKPTVKDIEKRKKILKIIQIALVIIVPLFLIFFCDSKLFIEGKSVWGEFAITAVVLVIFGFLALFVSNSGKGKSQDIFLSLYVPVGLILLTLNYALLATATEVVIMILGVASVGLMSFGNYVYFFLLDYGERKTLWIRIVAFALSCEMQLYYVISLFFSEILLEQITYITPGVFYVCFICFLVPFVIQVVKMIRAFNEKEKEKI